MNRGALELQGKLADHGKQAELARDFGVGPDRVSRWLSGKHRPDATWRAKLEDKFGIGWRLWDEDTDAPENADLAEADPEEPAA